MSNESLIECVADEIGDALNNVENAYWYRRSMDKSGFEIIFSTPEEYECCGEGKVIARRKHSEAAEQYVTRMRNLLIATVAIDEYERHKGAKS